MPTGDETFRIEVVVSDADVAIVELSGELDVVSMDEFEATLTAILSSRPTEIVFDLSQALFISIQGFAQIGRCGLSVERVRIRSGNDLARRIILQCGFRDVLFE